MRLAPRTYFGSQKAQRITSAGLCLTACDYPGDVHLPKHEHAMPGFFFLISGQHRETNSNGECCQPECSLIYHQEDAPHETFIGPKGMKGLNIAFEPSWIERIEVENLKKKDGWLLGRPLAKRIATTLLTKIGSASDAELESMSIELLTQISSCHGALDPIPPKWLQDVRDTIESRFDEDLSLTQLAMEAAVHPVYLARAFRRFYGLSLTEYLHQTRISNAFRLILDGETVGEAAASCGFCDQAYLTRLSRAKFGVAPSGLKWFRSSKPS